MITKTVCVVCIIALVVIAILLFTRARKSVLRFVAAALFLIALGLVRELKSLPLQFSSQEEAIGIFSTEKWWMSWKGKVHARDHGRGNRNGRSATD